MNAILSIKVNDAVLAGKLDLVRLFERVFQNLEPTDAQYEQAATDIGPLAAGWMRLTTSFSIHRQSTSRVRSLLERLPVRMQETSMMSTWSADSPTALRVSLRPR